MMMHRFQIRESHCPVNTLRTYLTDPRRSGVAANWVVMFCKLLSNPSWVWINTYKNTILMGWTSIYQLFWCELQGYKVLTHCQLGMEKKMKQHFMNRVFNGFHPILFVSARHPKVLSCWVGTHVSACTMYHVFHGCPAFMNSYVSNMFASLVWKKMKK